MPNQYKPLPPVDVIAPAIIRYWRQRLTDSQILDALLAHHIDASMYGMGLTSFISMRTSMGLLRTRKQAHTVDTIHPVMELLRIQYPNAGAREVVSVLFHEWNMSVSRVVVQSYFVTYEAELIMKRRARRLRRKRFYAAGLNDIWAVDQHDKWKYKFGLGLHIGVDPFSGKIVWLKVWWTNSNPRLILGYHLDTVEELEYMPMVSQSDPGNENFGLANGQTLLRHYHDPNLIGTLQHRWMNRKKNVMPEIAWSQLRRRWSPGFENILDRGVTNGWYNTDNLLESLIFRWVFIPWLQLELDQYRNRINDTKKRADRNKILPHGPPNHIQEFPENYGVLDFKIAVNREHIETVRQMYAPRDHEVFQLVPADFAQLAWSLHEQLGQPSVTRDNVWNIYNNLYSGFRAIMRMNDLPISIDGWEIVQIMAQDDYTSDDIDLIPDLISLPLRDNSDPDTVASQYLGGVNNGQGLDMEHLRQLDEQMEEDYPLPPGRFDLIEEGPLYVDFSDEDGSEEDAEMVDALLLDT
ncbi:hypothetical protein GGX14DRAFT_660301 [Mycena pura]|uniref:Integrase core domain-containing protein n=1 Tax=Mycena pura TaxID=153505 RepID=A0AAD6Y5J2_9AGAR|nr:hypothetical protein GGX14DRAFT_660301 [Mycena pura]